MDSNHQTLIEDYAKDLSWRVTHKHNIANAIFPKIFTFLFSYDIDRSKVHRSKLGNVEITFSVPHLVEHKWQGYLEYYRLRKYVPKELYGLQAVHQHVLHEFAHVLALIYDNVHTHNSYFVKWYLKLMKQFPYKGEQNDTR